MRFVCGRVHYGLLRTNWNLLDADLDIGKVCFIEEKNREGKWTPIEYGATLKVAIEAFVRHMIKIRE